MTDEWGGRRSTAARAQVATWLPAPCGKCGQTVTPDQPWVVGHKLARWQHPELIWVVSNWQPEHKRCSDASGQGEALAKAYAAGQAGSPHPSAPGQSPPLPNTYTGARSPLVEVRDDLKWPDTAPPGAPWLWPLLNVPDDASPPLAMSPPHPRATGSYGWDCIAWVEANVTEAGKPVRLRWWQQLAIVRQLEHDDTGRLVWRTVLETCPRRAGKSVRLRAMALWRIAHEDLFGEPQLVLHCGRDLSIAREIHRKAWKWAEERDGWTVRKGVGQEEISTDENRWLVRSLDAVYGFDVCAGFVDEAWDVKTDVVSEGLEPATLGRQSPQLLLTSTAHRRATNLMRSKLSAALAQEDDETLVLWWGALPDADLSDPETWRLASPHWDDDRARMVAAKYQAAVNGQEDAELDDVDPVLGFASQYANVWRLHERRQVGQPVTEEDQWGELTESVPERKPDAVAVESWYSDGVSVALAWRTDGPAIVTVSDHPDLGGAAQAVKASGFRGVVTVGASLKDDPALSGIRTVAGQTRTAAAVQDLARLLADDAIRHDGGEHLTGQVLAVRTHPSADGRRLVSKGRADAVKAATWAASKARKRRSGGPLLVLPDGVAS